MRRLVEDAWVVGANELRHLVSDRRSQALTLALPLVAMAAFAFSFAGQNIAPAADSEPYPMALQDRDGSAESRLFADLLAETGLFTLHVVAPDRDPAAYVRESGTFGVLVLPEGFGDAYRRGDPDVLFVYDNTKPHVGALTLSRVKLVLEAVASEQGRAVGFAFEKVAETRGSLDIFTPGIVVLLVAFTSLNDMAISITRERAEGTLGRVLLAPVSKGAFLLGKVGAGLVLAAFRGVALLAIAVVALGVAFRGSLAAYLAVVLLTALLTLGLGVLLAARARSEREVLVATLMVVIVLMFMMGAITPVDLMSPTAQAAAAFVPHSHAADALRRVMLLGEGALDVLPHLALLAGASAASVAAGAWLFRRTLDA